MSFSGAAIGAGVSVFVTMYTKFMMRTRALSRPWHYLYMGAGFGYVGYNYDGWHQHLLDLVNNQRELMGMRKHERVALPENKWFEDFKTLDEKYEEERLLRVARAKGKV